MQNFDPTPTMTEYLQQANDSILVMVQIETKEALEVVDEIAPLVDVLFIGPFDLGNNIGHPIINGVKDPELDAAIARVLEACKKAGTVAGMYCTSAEEARAYTAQGFGMISVATDITSLSAIMAYTVAASKVPQKL